MVVTEEWPIIDIDVAAAEIEAREPAFTELGFERQWLIWRDASLGLGGRPIYVRSECVDAGSVGFLFHLVVEDSVVDTVRIIAYRRYQAEIEWSGRPGPHLPHIPGWGSALWTNC